MSNFTHSAQQAYDGYTHQSSITAWDLKETMSMIIPFLQSQGGNLDAMPGLRQAFEQAQPQELQGMWTEYCHLGDLLFTLERELHK